VLASGTVGNLRPFSSLSICQVSSLSICQVSGRVTVYASVCAAGRLGGVRRARMARLIDGRSAEIRSGQDQIRLASTRCLIWDPDDPHRGTCGEPEHVASENLTSPRGASQG